MRAHREQRVAAFLGCEGGEFLDGEAILDCETVVGAR